MRKKTLYLECYSGISGDMAVAALIDLGVDHSSLLDALNSLNLDGYRVKISRVNKSGIDACDFIMSTTTSTTMNTITSTAIHTNIEIWKVFRPLLTAVV